MRTQVRIVAGTLRGRKLTCTVDSNLRPTPQMVREAFFSILGNAIPERPFFDVFAGTGVVGLEAISRGARSALLVERDFRLIADLEKHIREFRVGDKVQIARTDVYRWIERWRPPTEPVNVFLSPPFVDFESRLDALMNLVATLQEKLADESVLVLQSEHDAPLHNLPRAEEWEDRRYGRNHLLIWVKGEASQASETATPESLVNETSEEEE